MLTVAVDAMGGDHAPKPEVDGAIRAAKTLGVKVVLVGREDAVRRELESHQDYRSLPIEVHHASEQITMNDSAARAVRSKRDSSMRVASRLVRDGCAQGFVSAGNTGAVMATAKMVQGVVPHLERTAGGDRGRGRECRLLTTHAGAIRHHGRNLFARDLAPR
jgi:glycerol-3-phosphate acyltransferase PlsX